MAVESRRARIKPPLDASWSDPPRVATNADKLITQAEIKGSPPLAKSMPVVLAAKAWKRGAGMAVESRRARIKPPLDASWSDPPRVATKADESITQAEIKGSPPLAKSIPSTQAAEASKPGTCEATESRRARRKPPLDTGWLTGWLNPSMFGIQADEELEGSPSLTKSMPSTLAAESWKPGAGEATESHRTQRKPPLDASWSDVPLVGQFSIQVDDGIDSSPSTWSKPNGRPLGAPKKTR